MNEDLDPDTVSTTSSEAVQNATGKAWAEWMALLDAAGGRQMTHKELVAHLADHYDISSWWQQGVTVTYEKSRRLRDTHETSSGYQISRSRTMAAAAETIYNAWLDEETRRRWLPDAAFGVRKATPHKTIRIDWPGDTLVEVRLDRKGPEKTAVTVQHSKLPDGDAAEEMKIYWAAALGRLLDQVEMGD